MDHYKINFVVGITTEDLFSLQKGKSVISKLLLVPDDYNLFKYKEGDTIEAETPQGNRILTNISNIEIVEDPHRVIVILTLSSPADEKSSGSPPV